MPSRATVVVATLAALQDLGRPAASWWGVATNGAADQFSLAYANALVGNEAGLPCLETVVTDLAVRFDDDTVVAVAGAEADVTVDDVPARVGQAVHVAAGCTVSVRGIRRGARAYLAVLGGFRTGSTFLGSVSPDRTMDFGVGLATGTEIGYESVSPQVLPDHPFGYPHMPADPVVPDGMARLDVLPGENMDLFLDDARALHVEEYVLTDKTDAVGSRLAGSVPARLDTREILSRALPVGAVEVSGDELLVLNRGRGLSAGYPVVGVVSGPSMDVLSQLTPGATMRFIPTSVDVAVRERRRRTVQLESVRQRMSSMLAAAHDGLPPFPTAPVSTPPGGAQ